MDNTSRSERSRKAAIEAALTIISRDGPGQLTFDAIARESGISKGGIMHQFPNKLAMLKGLIEHQIEYFEAFANEFQTTSQESILAAMLAVSQEVANDQQKIGLAVLAALVEAPDLLSATREMDAERIKEMRQQASDPELSVLRWAAARGLALTSLLGLSPFSEDEQKRLFARLQDDTKWGTHTGTTT